MICNLFIIVVEPLFDPSEHVVMVGFYRLDFVVCEGCDETNKKLWPELCYKKRKTKWLFVVSLIVGYHLSNDILELLKYVCVCLLVKHLRTSLD